MDNIESLIQNTVSGYKRNLMQIAVFTLQNPSNCEEPTLYGINTAKIRSIEFYHDVTIQKNIASGGVFEDFCVVRGETYPIINLNKWIGLPSVDSKDPKLTDKYVLILAEFNKMKVAFAVHKVHQIHRKTSEELEPGQNFNEKVTYITKIMMEKRNAEPEEKLCFVLDVESLIKNPSVTEFITADISSFKADKNKKLLVAEDSLTAKRIIEKILTKLGVNFQFFKDGQELIEYSNKTNLNDVGLIITDIEMPRKDGFQVISHFKMRHKEIPVIVNSSMSNIGVSNKAKQLGADGFIEKTSPDKIFEIVSQHLAA